MSYKSAVYSTQISANDRVNRIFREINALSNQELQALRDRINAQHSHHNHTGEPGSEVRLKLDGLCVRVLSRREIDVLTLVAAGYSRKEIGESLEITPNTAAKHVSSIYRKLNISSIAEATRIAIENGVVASGKGLR